VIRDAFAPRASGVATQQIRRDARFIDEDVLRRIVERQRVCPLAPCGGDIRATLFVGVYGFFYGEAEQADLPPEGAKAPLKINGTIFF